MVGMLLQMLDLLFAVQHLPALDAKNLSVRLLLDCVQSVDEGGPLGRVTLDHSNSVSRLRSTVATKDEQFAT